MQSNLAALALCLLLAAPGRAGEIRRALRAELHDSTAPAKAPAVEWGLGYRPPGGPAERGSLGASAGLSEGKPLEMLLWGGAGATIGAVAGPLGAAVGGAAGPWALAGRETLMRKLFAKLTEDMRSETASLRGELNARFDTMTRHLDGLTASVEDSRFRWAVHADTLLEHDRRLKKLEARRS